mgnify:CR=1 FL=1
MTRGEAIEELERLLRHWDLIDEGIYDLSEHDQDAVEFAISALRPVSREQVEKVWRGEWTPGDSICPICEKNKFDGLDADIWADWMPSFCPNCGAPMTDEAVEMVMERMEEMKNG